MVIDYSNASIAQKMLAKSIVSSKRYFPARFLNFLRSEVVKSHWSVLVQISESLMNSKQSLVAIEKASKYLTDAKSAIELCNIRAHAEAVQCAMLAVVALSNGEVGALDEDVTLILDAFSDVQLATIGVLLGHL
jgi:hypothetical protein